MKKIITFAVLALVMTSCYYEDRYSWGGYDNSASRYINFAEEVLEESVSHPAITLDYIKYLYSLGYNKPGDHVVDNGAGDKVGPFICKVNGRDTTWSYMGDEYLVRQRNSDLTRWTLIRKDPQEEYMDPYYDFTLEAYIDDGDIDTQVKRNPWNIVVEGVRLEDSEYSLDFETLGPMKVVWNTPETFLTAEFVLVGELQLHFMKGDQELDWLIGRYTGIGTSSYEHSFND